MEYFYRLFQIREAVGAERLEPRAGRQLSLVRGRGAYDYLVKGKMIGGFALVAYPAKYGNSGIMTFMVNQDGTVFQKDLGPNTDKIAATINSFSPDQSWTKVDPSELGE